jgi:DNA-binding transcriptional LysR family regulator
MNKFTIRQLEYLVAVGQTGNLTEAARHLRVSQPAITSAIAHLEGVFGQQLFDRHRGSGVSPTAAGHRALVEARNILTLVDDFPGALNVEAEEISGTVLMGCFEPLACYQLPALLGAMAAEFPNVHIEFSLQTQSRIHDGLQNGEFDLGFSYDSGFWEDLKKIVLYHVTPYALLSANHRLAAQEVVSLTDLVGEPFILVDLPESREYQLSLMRSFGAEPQVRYYCGNLEVIRGLVANGLGVSLSVTRPVGDRCYDGHQLAYRPLVEAVPKQAVVLAYSKGVRLTRAAKAILEAIRRHYLIHAGSLDQGVQMPRAV